ncbi:metal ABC transporter solute-binding protein, Zn/Mn family [Stieleria varia]|uniref:Periplasmic zinc-binding protein TroA n=1 Tax=Stieleria varia TaxID=2528005 RepID=A0A5C5ZPE1_9BACT|nr:zinc ABC transporter substrate-binding protein [Stieleria varia]TWT89339.1 Periplasmic zinc-binding protein TroA precursor [Stieleria varia]
MFSSRRLHRPLLRNPHVTVVGIAVLVSSIVLLGCQPSATPSGSEATQTYSGTYPIQAVATVGMVADLVRTIGGPQVNVQQICGSGVDPHLYKPTRDDVQLILSADVVFYCGLLLEGKMGDTLQKVSKMKPCIAVAEQIDDELLLKPTEFEGHYDPHVWNDVSAWSKCVDAVAQSLSKFDPGNKNLYEERAKAYEKTLTELHAYGKRVIATVPEKNRVLITSHDAFNYFGRAYELDVMGIQGLSTESEAGLQRINELVDLLVDRDVKAVFIESSVSRKNIDALIEGSLSRGHAVKIGGELFSDAMGQAGTYEGTYVGMLDHNITLVAGALGGDVDPKGFSGKLAGTAETEQP